METTSPSENRQPLLRISNLRFGYDDDALFENFSLDIPAQSITALVGPNGAGKSTLLHCITGFLRPFAGEIRLAETPIFNDIENARRQMGYLSDDFGLYDQLTARQNMASIATAHGKDDNRILSAAADANLNDLLERYPNTLSRGQRQRLGIAMAILHSPLLLLLDEPASGLDPIARGDLSSLLKRLRDNGTTLIVSSHILSELREYATHYAIIDKGALQDAGELAATVTWRCRLSTAAALEPLQAVLNGRPDIRIDEQDNDTIFFHMSSGEDAAGILRELINAELPVCEFSRVEGDIERIYRNRLSKQP